MTILIGLSSLPFLNELIADKDGNLYGWVPDLNVQKLLTDSNGSILGYSKYRVFLYFLFIHLYGFIAFLGWYTVAKNKYYRPAILLCALSAAYHVGVVLLNQRMTDFNDFRFKLVGTIVLAVVLFALYYRKKKKENGYLEHTHTLFGTRPKKILTFKVVLVWLLLIMVSTLFYYHDIITLRVGGIKDWVPNIGIEELLTNSNGDVWGFGSYRAFILTLFLQLFAQIGWAGWLHDSYGSLYRPFLIAPLGLSLYQVILLLTESTGTPLNRPDIKLMLVLAIGTVLCILFFFRNKGLQGYNTDKKILAQNNNNSKN